MTAINMTLYRLLLRQNGVTEAEAEAAARVEASDLVTKADLAEFKADLFKHTNELMVKMTAIYAGIVILVLTIFGVVMRLLAVGP